MKFKKSKIKPRPNPAIKNKGGTIKGTEANINIKILKNL